MLNRILDNFFSFYGLGGRDDAKLSIPATVVLRYMFSTAEMRTDENLCTELEAEVKEECLKIGPVDLVKEQYDFCKPINDNRKTDVLCEILHIMAQPYE
ncbi:unnamed protein product [Ilex paraguariensis]|uniref:Uncharacterized protein n=1 Tax=Ilex paraguariensis TaxID=185542 RepID=A0ABC8RFB4_9AQUA